MNNIKLNKDKGDGIIRLSCPIDEIELAAPDKAKLAEKSGDGAYMSEDGNYLFIPFRAISKTIIPGYFLNLTKKDVLKNSLGMLKGRTVYPNHEQNVKDWVGVVMEDKWTDGKKGMPAGINVELRLDNEQAPWAVRALTSPPPKPLHSVSVDMRFNYECSICKLKDCEHLFTWSGLNRKTLGKEIDGKLCTMDVTEIKGYGEISLVGNGADPYAKEQETLSQFENEDLELTNAEKKGETKQMDLEKALKEMEEQKKTATIALEAMTGERDDLKVKLEASLALAKVGETQLSTVRADTEKNYRLLKGDKAVEVMLEQIKLANYETLCALNGEFSAQVELSMPISCKACGSTDISRRSSVESTDTEIKKETSQTPATFKGKMNY